MRKLLLGLCLAAMAQVASAQQSSIKGRIVDTLEKKNLQNAVVAILKKSDSSLLSFTRTNKNGEFLIPHVKPGSYVMLVTYPKFADFADQIEVKDQPENDIGAVPLTQKASLLEAVIIKSAGAVRIKGDT